MYVMALRWSALRQNSKIFLKVGTFEKTAPLSVFRGFLNSDIKDILSFSPKLLEIGVSKSGGHLKNILYFSQCRHMKSARSCLFVGFKTWIFEKSGCPFSSKYLELMFHVL